MVIVVVVLVPVITDQHNRPLMGETDRLCVNKILIGFNSIDSQY